MTVHREQGATCDRTHYLADGGGRELAYVALSRARHHSTIHAVAEDLDQALDDITYDWTRETHQQWVTVTDEPDVGHHSTDHVLDAALYQLADIQRSLDRLDRLQRPPGPEPYSPEHEPPAPDLGIGI